MRSGSTRARCRPPSAKLPEPARSEGEWKPSRRRSAAPGASASARATEVARVRGASERAASGARRVEELLGKRRQDSLESRISAVSALLQRLDVLMAGTAEARDAVGERAAALERRMLDERDTDDVTAQLRACSQAEAELQARLRAMGDSVTEAEVRATHLRDRRDEAAAELERIARGLGREIEPPTEALGEEEREEVDRKLERLVRRREALGPVNPLAEQEYSEALAHVNQLEEQRGDLESALAELEGLIRDTDRKIEAAFEETFDATQRNFEELIEHLFPGGRGRLRLVGEPGPRLGFGGGAGEGGQAATDPAAPGREPEEAAGGGGGPAAGGAARASQGGEM